MEKLTIEGKDGIFLVRIGDKFESGLTRVEALGIVASALFSPTGPVFVPANWPIHKEVQAGKSDKAINPLGTKEGDGCAE